MTSLAQTNQPLETKVAKRTKAGGRQKGTPNRNNAFLMRKLKDMFGKDFDPILKAAEMAVNIHAVAESTRDMADMKASVDAWDKVAQYVTPRLKAVDVQDSSGKAARQIRDVQINIVSAASDGLIEQSAKSLIKDLN